MLVNRRLGARLTIGAAALLGIVGVLAFVRSAPACEVQLAQVLEHPVARHDLVDFRHGPRVRASSALLANHHHPSFLVDGVVSPSAVEKWVSGPKDPKPWLELSWGSPHDVEEVVLVHAGAFEGPRLNESDYTIRCLGTPGEVVVRGNAESRAHHLLACARATGIRIEFAPVKAAPHDMVRLYEVEVWGQ